MKIILSEYQKDILEQCRDIAEQEWGIKNDYEAVLISSDGYIQTDPREIFNTRKGYNNCKSSPNTCCICIISNHHLNKH